MIVVSNLYVQYGNRVLFDNITTTLQTGEKIGLTGRNGAGKSTFLKILAGEIKSFQGIVDRPKSESLAYLHQDIEISGEKSVIDEAASAFEELNELEAKIISCENELTHRTDYESDSYSKIIDDLTHYTEQFEYRGGNQKSANTEKILKGLGFKSTDLVKKVNELSGGWQMRVELAKMLLTQPDYLLMDEPTNHLDIESILWLEDFLANYKGSVVIISHDKEFLDNITKRTIEIELGSLYDFATNYSNYLIQRKERRLITAAAFQNQQKQIVAKEKTIARFMAKANKSSMAKSMQKQLDKMDRIEIEDEDTSSIRLNFLQSPRSSEVLINGTNISKSYDNQLVFKNIDFKIIRGERVAFVGQNGMGKSTLAKILIGKENADEGEIILGPNTLLGYYAQNQTDSLNTSSTLLQVMEDAAPIDMRTKVRSILGSLMFSGEDVDKKISVLSGGERSRLALALLLLRPINLLVMDEPTNHLDIKAKEVLKKALLEYDGTLIVVSHDRSFLEGLTEKTIEFKDQTTTEYLGDINYFLERRKTDNFREIEKNRQPNIKAESKPNDALKTENNKEIAKIEQKITKLESEIKKIDIQMLEPDFFMSADNNKIIQKYEQLKEELDIEMEKWELLSI